MLDVFETAARYQMYHALGLLVVAWTAARWPVTAMAGTRLCFNPAFTHILPGERGSVLKPIVLTLAAALAAQAAHAAEPARALQCGHLFDSRSGKLLDAHTVVVRDGKIKLQ